jgi:AAA15 family ATPase/GTPase
MEKIKIKDFSVIQNIDLEIKRINIFIGEEATGKSVISKLLFFFKTILPELMFFNIEKRYDIQRFENAIKKEFKLFFPTYFWEKQDFFIEFQYPAVDFRIMISRDTEASAPKIKVELSEKLKKISADFLQIIPKTQIELHKIRQEITKKLFNKEVITDFIPSSRSFFSLIQMSIFSLTLYGQALDFFIQKFGSQLEIIKKQLQTVEIDETIKKLSKEILKGEYYFDGKEDWIYTIEKKKIKLRDSSSGQQEVTPILIWLAAISSYNDGIISEIIIEEPETHLFPYSQKKLVELFGFLYNQKETNFIITTHSPYILSAFNNLIYAKSLSKRGKGQKVEKIIRKEKWIDFDDISVFFIENGQLKDIKNYENQLIEAEPIDAVSNEISSEFEKLLDLDDE